MEKTRTVSTILIIASFVMLLVTSWGFLWVFSSASLAPESCQGGWIELWNTVGCRNLVYDQFGFLVIFTVTVILFVLVVRKPIEGNE